MLPPGGASSPQTENHGDTWDFILKIMSPNEFHCMMTTSGVYYSDGERADREVTHEEEATV